MSALLPLSAKLIFSSCWNSRIGPSPGSCSHAASARLPLAVIVYLVRRRRPTEASVARANPWATSFFGSSYYLLWARGQIRRRLRSTCCTSSWVVHGLTASRPRMVYDVVVIAGALDMTLPLGDSETPKGRLVGAPS